MRYVGVGCCEDSSPSLGFGRALVHVNVVITMSLRESVSVTVTVTLPNRTMRE